MDFADRFRLRERYSHVKEYEDGMCLLDYLAGKFTRLSMDEWLSEINRKRVLINGICGSATDILKRHDRVSLFEDLQDEPEVNLSFSVIYEDSELLVFDKPGNLCIHPTGNFYQHTLWFQAGLKYGELFFVGRLDRETSGLVLAGRSGKIAALLQTADFKIHKEYHVLVHGRFEKYIHARGFLSPDSRSIIAKKRRFSFEYAENSETADTELFPVEIYDDGLSLVKAVLHSGRMHQIRATLFSLGFPVAGDKLYGLDETLYNKIAVQSFSEKDRELLIFDNQALCCTHLEFAHPVTQKKISLYSGSRGTTRKFSREIFK